MFLHKLYGSQSEDRIRPYDSAAITQQKLLVVVWKLHTKCLRRHVNFILFGYRVSSHHRRVPKRQFDLSYSFDSHRARLLFKSSSVALAFQ